MDIISELNALGLTPKTWPQVLESIKAKLSPQDMERFSRLHKNFVGYNSDGTLTRFYDFIFSHDLHVEVNCFRHRRLVAILTDLVQEVKPGLSILDVGAGAGFSAAILYKHFRPKTYVADDLSIGARNHLNQNGFQTLPRPVTPPSASFQNAFDLILCADSLGEINSDEDGVLNDPAKAADIDLPTALEQRYGFAQKLERWKNFLSPDGRVLLWEPIADIKAWEALAALLGNWGWNAKVTSREPGRYYLELTLEK